MKVVTWNCNGAFRNKYKQLDEFNADLLVIQECEDPATSTERYRDWADRYLWHGENKNRGIGVFARGEAELRRLNWVDEDLKSFLPCVVNGTVTLIATWTKSAPDFQYIGQLWKYLEIHRERLHDSPFLVCGDLNSNKCWDEPGRSWNHSDVVRELSNMNAVSVYHEHFGENQGAESRPTLYHQRNQKKPYHVDYAFATPNVWNSEAPVSVGRLESWIEFSDHMPFAFSINRDL